MGMSDEVHHMLWVVGTMRPGRGAFYFAGPMWDRLDVEAVRVGLLGRRRFKEREKPVEVIVCREVYGDSAALLALADGHLTAEGALNSVLKLPEVR